MASACHVVRPDPQAPRTAPRRAHYFSSARSSRRPVRIRGEMQRDVPECTGGCFRLPLLAVLWERRSIRGSLVLRAITSAIGMHDLPLIICAAERFPPPNRGRWSHLQTRRVLEANPAVNAVYAYEKGKDRGKALRPFGLTSIGSRDHENLRKERFKYAILANPTDSSRDRFARPLIGARHL